MSYIISKNSPFVSTKLTEKGREKLAKGQLNFRYWALGDSEINYGYEEIKDVNQGDPALNKKSILSTPKDNHPNIKYFVSKTIDGSPYLTLGDSDVKVAKLLINNRAEERGFFEADGTTKSGVPYVVTSGTVPSDNFNGKDGSKIINISDNTLTVGNYILFKLTNEVLGAQPLNSTEKPTQHLWYRIEEANASNYTLDRDLPLLANTNTQIQYIEYASGEVYENGMGNNASVPYWDADTLSFDSNTNVQMDSVPVLNMNNIWSSNIIGLDTTNGEEFFKYGSNDMMGIRSPFLCYVDTISPSDIQLEDVCVDASGNEIGALTGGDNKAISVIHYTNNSISNHYGEFFYIDDSGKTLELEIPTLMYHRRAFEGGSGTGDIMGMKFVSKGDVYYIKNSEIEYVELIEDPTMVNGEPKVVGKILPQHQTIIIDNEEIVAALSYKSGRNWTLPELSLTLTNPAGGGNTGLLAQGETVYVTYVLEDIAEGVAYNLPCQQYAKIENKNLGTKDVSFIINDVDELPYMRKREAAGYDGMGFSATHFKVLYQVVAEGEKPVSNAWKEHDFTNVGSSPNNLTITSNTTIDPNRLQNQLPDTNGFKLTKAMRDTDGVYVINDKLGLPNNSEPSKLQFGDERFFYGNLRTYIGASVYRTVFDVKVSANEFIYTSNPTRSIDDTTNPPEIRVSEVGIYDADKSLVFIGKLSEPIKLINGNSVTIELSMDF
jgi:hypothetical protein